MIKIEKNTDVRIKCYKCGNQYDMTMMRMDSNGKNLVCRSCLDRKPIAKESVTSIKKEAPKQTEEVKEYFCKECRYNFKRGKKVVVSVCPYCGSSDSGSNFS